MSSSENLLKATLNRLSVRIGGKILNAASEIAGIAQDAPDRLKEEWETLKEEIINEANRLDIENKETNENFPSDYEPRTAFDESKNKIQKLREKISQLTKEIEGQD